MEPANYIYERDGTYYIRGQRVRLASIVYDWNNGASPETIADNFPVLKLAEVYGAIAYYLDHRSNLDQHFIVLNQKEREVEAKANQNEHSRALHARFEMIRQRREISAS